MTQRLIRGAALVTMDDTLGDFGEADVLIAGGLIVAVGKDLPHVGAEIIDGRGRIVIPGLINAHMHTWQTCLRGVAANWTLLEYFRQVHAGLATLFTPEDIYLSTLAGALNQINCGCTTLVDWCHNNPTSAHSDRAIDGLEEAGIRAAFFHGSPKPDPKPGEKHFSEIPHPRREVERLLKTRFNGTNPLLSLGLAILGPHYSTLDVAMHDFALAKEFGLIASMHQGGGEAKTPDGWDRLDAAGLLGRHVNIVHGNNLSDVQLARFVELGMSFSVTPENEMMQGHGFPITGRLRRLGAAPTLGVALESALSGDLFTVARMALGMQRALDNAASREQRGSIPETSTVRAREALSWVTMDGARMLGMADRLGSITPGKQADLVILDARLPNMQPVLDPVNSVVTQASIANVEAVLVAGEFRKRHGRLHYPLMDERLAQLTASGRRIAGALGIGPEKTGRLEAGGEAK
ncbi:MAG: amidohydrolase family protein [Proteobacteria bacterium]|nr:amidohydrolase family protein [Pseudomonadota bacterium]